MWKLSEAAPAGSAAQTEPPWRPPGEARGTGLGQAPQQELGLAFEGERIASITLCDLQGLGRFCSLSQITSVHFSEELQFCVPQKEEFTVNPVWFRMVQGQVSMDGKRALLS